ncbi:MAG: hypothetical protein QXD72_02550 [Candidatus Aenigmatarchaeota archaeon]
MRKATIPIPHIIALILGVIVVVVLAHWFISTGGGGVSVGSDAECTARKVEFCGAQTIENWEKQRTKCGSARELNTQNCKNFCQTIMPGWKPTPNSPCPQS